MSNDEKVTENIKEIVNGAGRIIDSLGSLIGRGRNTPPKEETKNVGRRNDDEDDNDNVRETGASLKTRIDDDKIVVALMVGEQAVKEIRLSEEETEAHIKDLQKRLKGLRAQKEE